MIVRLAVVVALCASCLPRPALRSQAREGSPFAAGPYLLTLPGGRFAVALEADLDRPPRVDWRTVEQTERAATSRPTTAATGHAIARSVDDIWVAMLEGLPRGRRVAYRVSSQRGRSSEHIFQAGPREARRFRFLVFGDTRTHHDVHRATIERIVAERFDFALHLGDLVENGGIRAEWHDFFAIEHPLLATRPLLPVIGNHDLSTARFFARYFLPGRPTPVRYFSRDWGQLRIVLLDALDEYRAGSSQHDFLRERLAEAAARQMLTVVAVHEPPYSCGKHGSNLRLRRALRPLLERYGVELVVSGHDHNYERVKPVNGVTYLVSGSAGAPIGRLAPQPFTAVTRTEPHYVLIDVEPRGLVVRAVNLRGITFDTAVIAPSPPRPG
jgi:predicted phosphodiesterase